MVVDDSLYKQTSVIKDLGFNVKFDSKDKYCQMDIESKLTYDDYLENKETMKYLIIAGLVTVFDLLVILLTITRFESHDFVCKSQSVIFWTGIGMLNCLFCFSNIYLSTENFNKMSYFFYLALLNFINFSLIVLRILHRIGKVQISILMGDNVV